MKNKRPGLWPIWLLIAAYILYQSWPELRETTGLATKAGSSFPDFQLHSLSGDKLNQDFLQGKITVVNFWATWCPPCVKEMPFLNRIDRQYRSNNLQVVGLNTDGIAQDKLVREFITNHHIEFVTAHADKALLRDLGNVSVIPTTYVVGPDREILKIVRGALNEPAFEASLHEWLDSDNSGLE